MVNIGMLVGSKVEWSTLATIKDSNTTSLYVYESMVTIPEYVRPGRHEYQVVTGQQVFNIVMNI